MREADDVEEAADADVPMTAGVSSPAGIGSWSDADLWPLVEAGDHSAFQLVFERHVAAVWNYAYRLTGARSAAEDLTAIAFLTLWRRRTQARLVSGSVRPWLFTVAARTNRSERRRIARFLAAVPRLARGEPHADPTADLVDRAGTRARLDRAMAAIRTLPPAEREAMELCALGRMSTSEAAVMLGIAEASVRSRLSRARTRLRASTKEDADD